MAPTSARRRAHSPRNSSMRGSTTRSSPSSGDSGRRRHRNGRTTTSTAGRPWGSRQLADSARGSVITEIPDPRLAAAPKKLMAYARTGGDTPSAIATTASADVAAAPTRARAWAAP